MTIPSAPPSLACDFAEKFTGTCCAISSVYAFLCEPNNV